MTDTTKVKEALDKILDNFAIAILSGDMILDVKEMETIPQIITLIDKYTRDSTRTFREGYEKALSDSNQERVETLSAWIHEDYIEGERLAKSINKKLGVDELTEQKDGE